jgi:hypothetical protein
LNAFKKQAPSPAFSKEEDEADLAKVIKALQQENLRVNDRLREAEEKLKLL